MQARRVDHAIPEVKSAHFRVQFMGNVDLFPVKPVHLLAPRRLKQRNLASQ